MNRLCLLILIAALAPAQVADKANERYRTPKDRDAVMRTILGAPGRAGSIQAAKISEGLALKPGMTVADIGSGAGVMLPLLSQAVGPTGRVLAEDIFDEFLAKARETARTAGLTNVSFIKGDERDPHLPPASVDLAVSVDSYHHFDYPIEMLAGIRKALRPGGRLIVIDPYKRVSGNHVRLGRDEVIKEVEANGFALVETHDHVRGIQYWATFRRR